MLLALLREQGNEDLGRKWAWGNTSLLYGKIRTSTLDFRFRFRALCNRPLGHLHHCLCSIISEFSSQRGSVKQDKAGGSKQVKARITRHPLWEGMVPSWGWPDQEGLLE